jgi:hypothetical protein
MLYTPMASGLEEDQLDDDDDNDDNVVEEIEQAGDADAWRGAATDGAVMQRWREMRAQTAADKPPLDVAKQRPQLAPKPVGLMARSMSFVDRIDGRGGCCLCFFFCVVIM